MSDLSPGCVRWLRPSRRAVRVVLPLAGMAHLYKDTGVKSLYSDRKFMGGRDGWQDAIEVSTTLYIGNLSFYTTEEQVLTHSLHLPRRVVE